MSIETKTDTVQAQAPKIEDQSKAKETAESSKAVDASAAAALEKKAELEVQEGILQSQRLSFVKVGQAFRAIRDHGLNAAAGLSFEDYCPKKWGYSVAHVYRLIDAAKVMETLEAKPSPIGEGPLPANEAQVRPLTRLKSDKWVEVWKKVLKKAGKRPITETLVEQVIEEMETEMGPSTKLKKKSKKADPKAEAKAKLQRVSSELKELGSFLGEKQYAKIRSLLKPLLKEIEKHLLTLNPSKS